VVLPRHHVGHPPVGHAEAAQPAGAVTGESARGGHVSRFCSVAEHCVLVSQAVAPENAPLALLHDATEAYLGDMAGPVLLCGRTGPGVWSS
jgi:5'-nucleotidase